MWTDLVTALAVYVGSMMVLGVCAIYLHWDRR